MLERSILPINSQNQPSLKKEAVFYQGYNYHIMNKIKAFYQSLTLSESSVPFAILVVCSLSFGLLIPRLGFYMDDWHYVFYSKLKGVESLTEMLRYDIRPGASWLYILGFRLLGSNIFYWHIANFLLTVCTSITYWLFLRGVYGKQNIIIVYTSLLFSVYPFFMLHASPIGYFHIWFGFIVFNLSLVSMVISFHQVGYKKFFFTTLSLFLAFAHLFSSEYFAGLELIRFIILIILIFKDEQLSSSKKLGLVFKNWLPYIFVLAIFFYWRIFIYQNPEGVIRNEPVLLSLLVNKPFQAIYFLLYSFIADSVSVLSAGWQMAMNPSNLNFNSPYTQGKLFICFVVGVVTYLYSEKLNNTLNSFKKDEQKSLWVLALFALLTSGLPIWFIGRSITESQNLVSASRFGLPTIFGASLFIILMINYFIDDKKKKSLFFSLIMILSINFQFDVSKEFQLSWEKQERFISQLLWRAPTLESGTAILTDQEVLGVMGEYAVSFSINTAYQVKDFGNTPPHWYFPFLYTNPNVDELLAGTPLEYQKLTMTFNGNSNQMLLLDFNPELKRCLWVLQSQDTNLRLVSEEVRKLSAGSNINLIKQSDNEVSPPEEIYGRQNTQTWCYYFQKADLARQYQEWDKIVRLWDESQEVGERPDNGFEYIPFIEGFGHTGDWEKVKEMTKFAKRITSGLEPSLCSALDRLTTSAPESQERDDTIFNLKEDLNCKDYQ